MWRKRVEPLRGSKRFLDTFPSLGPKGRSGNVWNVVVTLFFVDNMSEMPPINKPH
jgi:hypothetical protein